MFGSASICHIGYSQSGTVYYFIMSPYITGMI